MKTVPPKLSPRPLSERPPANGLPALMLLLIVAGAGCILLSLVSWAVFGILSTYILWGLALVCFVLLVISYGFFTISRR